MPSSEESSLDSFWKLSDSKEKTRIDAAFKIITHLQIQKRQNQDNFNENIDYDLKRIVCGLASDRITARKGYFTSLVQMIKIFPDEASIPKVFELMEKHLSVKGSKSVSFQPALNILPFVPNSQRKYFDKRGISLNRLIWSTSGP